MAPMNSFLLCRLEKMPSPFHYYQHFTIYFLLLFTTRALYSQSTSQLENTWWEVTKVVEIIRGDTTIYGSKPGHLSSEFMLYPYFGSNSKYVEDYDTAINKDTDAFGRWKIIDSKIIEIILDSTSKGYNKNFSQILTLTGLTDSSATFLKNITRNGIWTREYYLIKRKR